MLMEARHEAVPELDAGTVEFFPLFGQFGVVAGAARWEVRAATAAQKIT